MLQLVSVAEEAGLNLNWSETRRHSFACCGQIRSWLYLGAWWLSGRVLDSRWRCCSIRSWLYLGAGWLSGRVLDLRWRCCGIGPHWMGCLVSLSKTLYLLLCTGWFQEDTSRCDWKTADWDINMDWGAGGRVCHLLRLFWATIGSPYS